MRPREAEEDDADKEVGGEKVEQAIMSSNEFSLDAAILSEFANYAESPAVHMDHETTCLPSPQKCTGLQSAFPAVADADRLAVGLQTSSEVDITQGSSDDDAEEDAGYCGSPEW